MTRLTKFLLENDSEWNFDESAEHSTYWKEISGGKVLVVGFESGGRDISVYAATYASHDSWLSGEDPESIKSVKADSASGPEYRFVNEVYDLLNDGQVQRSLKLITDTKLS